MLSHHQGWRGGLESDRVRQAEGAGLAPSIPRSRTVEVPCRPSHPVPKSSAMLNNLEATIQQIINDSSADMAKQIATAVRQALAAEIIGSTSPVPAPRRTRRAQRTAAKAPAAHRAATKPAKLVRRSSKEVAKDDAAILQAIKAHAGSRSLDLQKLVKLPGQNIASGLRRLREAGKITMKGVKASAKYTVG